MSIPFSSNVISSSHYFYRHKILYGERKYHSLFKISTKARLMGYMWPLFKKNKMRIKLFAWVNSWIYDILRHCKIFETMKMVIIWNLEFIKSFRLRCITILLYIPPTFFCNITILQIIGKPQIPTKRGSHNYIY